MDHRSPQATDDLMWGQPPSAVHRAKPGAVDVGVAHVGRTLPPVAFDVALDLAFDFAEKQGTPPPPAQPWKSGA